MPNTVTAHYRARDGDEHHAAVERPPMARWRVLDHAAAQVGGHPGAHADDLLFPPSRGGGVADAVGGLPAARPNRGGTAGAGSAAPNRRRSMEARDRIEIEMPFLLAAIGRAGESDESILGRDRDEAYDGPERTAPVCCLVEHCGGWRSDRWIRRDDGGGHWESDWGGPSDGDVRRALRAAERAGLAFKVVPKCGRQVWGLTPAGAELLARLRTGGLEIELPESPQHRAWRHRRAEVIRELPEIRRQLRDHGRALIAIADSADVHALAIAEEQRVTRHVDTFTLRHALEDLDAEEPA